MLIFKSIMPFTLTYIAEKLFWPGAEQLNCFMETYNWSVHCKLCLRERLLVHNKNKIIPKKSCLGAEFICLQTLTYLEQITLLFLVLLPSATSGLQLYRHMENTGIINWHGTLVRTEKLLPSSLPWSFTSATLKQLSHMQKCLAYLIFGGYNVLQEHGYIYKIV